MQQAVILLALRPIFRLMWLRFSTVAYSTSCAVALDRGATHALGRQRVKHAVRIPALRS